MDFEHFLQFIADRIEFDQEIIRAWKEIQGRNFAKSFDYLVEDPTLTVRQKMIIIFAVGFHAGSTT